MLRLCVRGPGRQLCGQHLRELVRGIAAQRRRGALIYTSFCRYGLFEDHIATAPHDIDRVPDRRPSLDDYAAGLSYMTGLAHDAGQSACDLFKDYPQSLA